jgi:hypothetical protein
LESSTSADGYGASDCPENSTGKDAALQIDDSTGRLCESTAMITKNEQLFKLSKESTDAIWKT